MPDPLWRVSFSQFATIFAKSSSKMSQNDNLLIQIRALLQSDGEKLWEEPYYSEDLGSIEGALEVRTICPPPHT